MRLFFARIMLTIGLSIAMVGGLSGCTQTLAPGGVYQGDKALYNADVAITTAYGNFERFVKWEHTYRDILPVEVSRTADFVRLNSQKWIQSAIAMREAYASAPLPGNRDKLLTAVALIDAALDDASKYMSKNKRLAPNSGLTNR